MMISSNNILQFSLENKRSKFNVAFILLLNCTVLFLDETRKNLKLNRFCAYLIKRIDYYSILHYVTLKFAFIINPRFSFNAAY